MTQADKRSPSRRCIGCMQVLPKEQLIRIVSLEGRLTADPSAKLPGRGCYICRKRACLEKAVKKNGFGRSLKIRPGKENVEKISEELFQLL